MKQTHAEKVEVLRKRRAQIDAELQRLAALERSQSRKRDTRRKVLIGAVILQEMANRAEFADWVYGLLRERLTRPRDRELFARRIEK